MGEAILKKLVTTRPDADQWHVESAGTWAMEGSGPAYLSKYVMELMGMDISAHRAQAINLRMLQKFDLILTMETQHKKWLKRNYSDFSKRTYLMSEMVDENSDIPDPIGGELADYQETAQQLERIITNGLDRICQIALINQDF